MMVVTPLFTKLLWPGDPGDLQSGSVAATCLLHIKEASHFLFSLINVEQGSCEYQLWFNLLRNLTQVHRFRQVLHPNACPLISIFVLAPQWTNKRKMEKILHAEPAGNTVTFRCTAQGEPPLTAKWFKDDEFITKDKRIGGYKVELFLISYYFVLSHSWIVLFLDI